MITVSLPCLGSVVRYNPGMSESGFPCNYVEFEIDQPTLADVLKALGTSGLEIPRYTDAELEAKVGSRTDHLHSHYGDALDECKEEYFERGYREALMDLGKKDPR